MISVVKIIHKGEQRIKLLFDRDQSIVKKIKTLTDRKWSATLGAWHIPYTKEAYNYFLQLNLEHRIVKPGATREASLQSDNTSICKTLQAPILQQVGTSVDVGIHQKKDGISIRFQNAMFYVFLDYQKKPVDFLKSLKATYWSPKNDCWIVRGNIENLNSLHSFFEIWDADKFIKLQELILKVSPLCKVEIYRVPEYPREVCIKVTGVSADVSVIKKVTQRSYDKQYKRWRIPYDPKIIERIKAYYTSQQIQLIDRLPESGSSYIAVKNSYGDFQKRLMEKLHPETAGIISEYTNVLIAQRYSRRTIKQYSAAMIKYIEHINRKAIQEHSASDVNGYLAYISKKNISESYINATYSAIKLYYEKVAFIPDFQFDRMKRPRKSKYLPTILSKSEINRILTACTNLKHSTLLYTLYSSGMRLTEVLNLRVEDVWWDRNQIIIKAGKGKKDRIVMLSRVLKEILSLYADKYKPIHWLFEGRDRRTQYASSSVQKVVKRAVNKAGIYKRITPHTLRHCFATHLMDSGTDVRFIQELLGHKDIKTTLIYTHVTTNQIDQIESPLDRLQGINEIKSKKPE